MQYGRGTIADLTGRDISLVENSEKKTNYLVIDDSEEIHIYDMAQHKTVRKIPHKDGKLKVNVYGATEGHILVTEHHKKEGWTRFSIEVI